MNEYINMYVFVLYYRSKNKNSAVWNKVNGKQVGKADMLIVERVRQER